MINESVAHVFAKWHDERCERSQGSITCCCGSRVYAKDPLPEDPNEWEEAEDEPG